jgi:hypothetical protein
MNRINTRKQNHVNLKRAGILFWVLLFFFIFVSTSVSWAGSISPGEKKLVKQAEGTFSYDGVTYYAYGKSLDKLEDYLSQDHLTLSKPLIRKAQRYMKDPVYIRMAAASGYIYPVGVKGNFFPEFQQGKRAQDEEALLKSDLYKNHSTEIDQIMMKISAQSMSQQVVLRSFPLLSGKAAIQTRHKAEDAEYSVLMTIRSCLTVIEFVILAALLLLIAYLWKGSALSDKKRMRKVISVILIAGIGVNCLLASLFFVHRMTLGSYTFLKKTMVKSTLTADTRRTMKGDMDKILIREGFSDAKASTFVYDQVFDNEYQYFFVQKLKGQKVHATSSGINEDAFLTLKPKGVNKKIAVMETEYNLRRAYRHALKLQPAGFIHTLWSNVQKVMSPVIVFGMLMLLFGLIAILRISEERKFFWRRLSVSFGIAGLLTLVLFGLLTWGSSSVLSACKALMMGNYPEFFLGRVKALLLGEGLIWLAAAVVMALLEHQQTRVK